MSTVKRACDACHRRKVRCDGKNPCQNCHHASLTCTFNAIPQKKGPKGSRAKVISELRRAQRQPPRSIPQQDDFLALANRSAVYAKTPGLLTPETINACLDFFFQNMYPTMPILHRSRLQQQLSQIDQSVELYCLIASLCAFMMIQPGMRTFGEGGQASSIASGKVLLDEALKVRKGYEYVEMASTHAVITSFFLFGCYFGLDKHNTAWFHLREATTLAQILNMQDENGYLSSDMVENTMKRRLFWLLFVTERAYALQRHRPLTLHSTIALPSADGELGEPVGLISGFLHLVNLFRPFDDIFVGLWNKSRADCSTAWLSQLQKQLAIALPLYLNSTESQTADLRTSQQWLRTMVWRLSISNGYLTSNSSDTAMTVKFPLEIARDLVGVTSQLSQESMEVHGIGLIEKVYDIASALTDVMNYVPVENHAFEFGPRDYLNQCLNLISTLRGGDSRFLPQILQKIDSTLPTMAAPMAPMLPWDPSDSGDGSRVEELFDSASSNASSFGSPATLLLDGLDFSPPKIDESELYWIGNLSNQANMIPNNGDLAPNPNTLSHNTGGMGLNNNIA